MCQGRSTPYIVDKLMPPLIIGNPYNGFLGPCFWIRSQWFCDAHRIAQIQTSNSSLVPADTSGMLSTALCQRDLSALSTLRSVLREVVQERLEICYGYPPEGRAMTYREQVSEQFLPMPTALSRSRRDCKTQLRLQQRFVLGQLFNGDLESPTLYHFCTFNCCSRFEDTLSKMLKWGVWALLPHKCPKYVQSRWTGQEASITWCALLMAHHNLFEPMMLKFAGSPQGVVVAPTAGHDDDNDDQAFLASLLDNPNPVPIQDTSVAKHGSLDLITYGCFERLI